MTKNIILLVLFFVGFLFHLIAGLDSPLTRDGGIYYYSSLRILEGTPPYRGIFDHKGPGGPFIFSIFLFIFRKLGGSEPLKEILFVRFITSLFVGFILILLFLIAKEFLGKEAALLSTLSFLTFEGFWLDSSSGFKPKTFMLFFFLLFIYLFIKENFFWAGVSISISTIIWQPVGIFSIMGLTLLVKRKRELLNFILGGLSPLTLTILYFLFHKALQDLWEGAVVFNIKYILHSSLSWNIEHIRRALIMGYRNSSALILLGLFLFPYLIKRAPKILLLCFPWPILWSLKDFQWIPDIWIFLPFSALGLGILFDKTEKKITLTIISLLIIALLPFKVKGPRKWTLKAQLQEALDIKRTFGDNIITIGAPHFMAIARLKNPSKYVFVIRGIDRKIEKEFPRGIRGWFHFILRKNPKAIVYAHTYGPFINKYIEILKRKFPYTKKGKYFTLLLREKLPPQSKSRHIETKNVFR